MTDRLFYFFFKLCRKIRNSFSAFANSVRLKYYYYISEKRFSIAATAVTGKRFSIKSDLSKTHLTVADNFHCRDDFNITLGHGGLLTIGHHCFFNNHCSINCLGNIEIGNNCQFGENVLMYDHNHRFADKTKLVSAQGYDTGKIKIGNNCWVGANVVILKGVEIGDNVVIGAGCVIFKSVESGSVVINQQNLIIKKNIE